MKVSLHPSDGTGCGEYRIRLPAAAAQAHGVECEVVDQRAPVTFVEHEGGIGVRARDPGTDVVVLQRVFSTRIADLIPTLHRLGQAVVVDIDDDVSCIQPGHPASRTLSPAHSPDMNWRHLARACAHADLVTVPSQAMAERFGGHGRVAVLPNCVPERLLAMPRSSDGETCGWAGWAAVHPGDLEATRGGVQEALARSGWRFHVVGPGDGARQALSLADEPSATGGLALEDYYTALGSLDVGISPLADIRFNSGKGHKGLELAARGVPFVSSPVAHYPQLASEGIGVLAAERARSWRSALTRLMGDERLREECAARGREAVAAAHTYEGEGWRWCEAWSSALENFRARSRTWVAA